MSRGGERASGVTVALLDTLLQTAPVGLGFVDRDLRFVRVNEMLAAMNGVAESEHLGRTVDEVLPHLAGVVGPILNQVLRTRAPVADIALDSDDRHWVASYYPVWADDDDAPVGVGVVVRDVSEHVRAGEQLEARARHLDAVATLGQRALVSDDFDGLMAEGIETVTTILGADFAMVLEHDREARTFTLHSAFAADLPVGKAISDDPETRAGYALANRRPVVVPDVSADSRFKPNPLLAGSGAVSVLNVVIRGPGWPFGVLALCAVTPRHFLAEEVDFAQSMANVLGTAAARHKIDLALRSERERLRLALDAGGMGDWHWDLVTGRVSWSEAVERIYGLVPGTFAGTLDAYRSLIHPEDRDASAAVVEAALAGDEPFEVEHRVVLADGSMRWVRGNGRVVRDDSGVPVSMIGVSADVTERIEAEARRAALLAAEQEARAEAEAARDRLAFLAEASEVLASSLDYKGTLSQVAHLAVPRLADWCTVDVVEDDGAMPTTVVVAHADPAKVAMADEFRRMYPPDPDSEDGTLGVIRSGQPQVIALVTDEMLMQAAQDDEHLARMRELELRSALVVPLNARGRTLGALTMISSRVDRVYGDEDLALAMDLARRAALAIDNSLLYRERSQVAEALQHSLLPPRRPEIPGLEVAVRYQPVGRGTEIGGDFYDVFESAPGVWSVVIGDVCGKGTAAAALTGLARDTIRGVSIREASPQRVLRVLNEVVLRRDDESRFLTVALARVEPPMVAGHTARAKVRVACGGHPLPLLARAGGGRVEEAGRPSLLLGLFPDVSPVDVDVELRPGDSLVFFTDGVLEQQGPDGLFGEDRLRDVLAGVGPCDAEGVAQAVLDAVTGWSPGPLQDDVAIVVLRVP
jgi:PAS domain S-box-containing protein